MGDGFIYFLKAAGDQTVRSSYCYTKIVMTFLYDKIT